MLTLTIKTDNAAFHEDDRGNEVPENDDAMKAECARILRAVAKDLENGNDHGRCMDVNGNGVGSWEVAND